MLRIKLNAKTFIGEGEPCFIIAEAGINHNGDLRLARKMIDLARDCGADAVKFQTFKAEEFISDRSQTYVYRSRGRLVRESMYELFKRHEFNARQFAELAGYCRKKKIIFMSTPQNVSDLRTLLRIGIPAIKVGSDDLTNLPLLEAYARTGLPVIISTGMSYWPEIAEAAKTVLRFNKHLVILLCVSSYPAQPEEANLNRLKALELDFPKAVIGYSDHTSGVAAAQVACALGAKVIEKHFTLDRDMSGPDHYFSADPRELKALVSGIRNIEKLLGQSEFRPSANEEKMRLTCRRSVVAGRDIPQGKVISIADLDFKRPGTGIPPGKVNTIIRKKALVDIPRDCLIRREEIG